MDQINTFRALATRCDNLIQAGLAEPARSWHQKTAAGLRALAYAWEIGYVPDILIAIQSIQQVAALMNVTVFHLLKDADRFALGSAGIMDSVQFRRAQDELKALITVGSLAKEV